MEHSLTTRRTERMDSISKRHTSEMDPQANTSRTQMIDLAISRHKTAKPVSYHSTKSFSIREDEEPTISLSASEAREYYLSHLKGDPKPKSAFFTAKDDKLFRHDDNNHKIAYRQDQADDPLEWFKNHLRQEGYNEATIERMVAT